jgi:hypothetical protein
VHRATASCQPGTGLRTVPAGRQSPAAPAYGGHYAAVPQLKVYQQQLLQLVNTLLVLVARNIALN